MGTAFVPEPDDDGVACAWERVVRRAPAAGRPRPLVPAIVYNQLLGIARMKWEKANYSQGGRNIFAELAAIEKQDQESLLRVDQAEDSLLVNQQGGVASIAARRMR